MCGGPRFGVTVALLAVAAAAAACGGGGEPEEPEASAPIELHADLVEIAKATTALGERLGPEVLDAVVLALDAGYDGLQLADGVREGRLEADGTILDGAGRTVAPANGPQGLIEERAAALLASVRPTTLERIRESAARMAETFVEVPELGILLGDRIRLADPQEVRENEEVLTAVLVTMLAAVGYTPEQIILDGLLGEGSLTFESCVVAGAVVIRDRAGRLVLPEGEARGPLASLCQEAWRELAELSEPATTDAGEEEPAEDEPPPEPPAGRVFVGAFAEDRGLVGLSVFGPGSGVLANRIEIAVQDATARVTAKLVLRGPVHTRGDGTILCTADQTIFDTTATLAVKADAIQGSFPFTFSDYRNPEGSDCELRDPTGPGQATIRAKIEGDAVTGTIALAVPGGSVEAPFTASAGG